MNSMWNKIRRNAISNTLTNRTTAEKDVLTFFRDDCPILFPTPHFTNKQQIKMTCVQLSSEVFPTWVTPNALQIFDHDMHTMFMHTMFNVISIIRCNWGRFLLELRFLHCKFTCRMLGGEDSCVATMSNISCPWTPATNLGHEIGNVLRGTRLRARGNCYEKCNPMGRFGSVFPGFQLRAIIFSTFLERCLHVV